jgi:hypothetical protein
MSKYNWQLIQEDYNTGLSLRKLQEKYKMSSRTLTQATRSGKLITRSKSEAAIIDNKENPRTHTEEWKAQQSKRILEKYETGWMPKAGRCKKYKYTSPVAGTVSLDGTWELTTAKWLDKQGYTWQRNTTRFPYTNLKGKLSHYTPDFYVEGIGYVEVKGYQTKLDECKWQQFNEPLTVWYRDKIKEFEQDL